MSAWDQVFAKIDQVQKKMDGLHDEVRRTKNLVPLVFLVWMAAIIVAVWWTA